MQKKIWIAAVALAALAGVAATIAFWPPAYRLVADAVDPDRLRETRQTIGDPLTSEHWRKARVGDKGVTIWDPINALRGFTLYTSGEGPVARLVTMTGAQFHEWTLPYSAVWSKETASVQEPQPDDLVFWRHARAMPNGDLIALYEAAGHVPAGYGLVKLDKDSRPLWRYLQRAHGSFDVAPDGRVFVLVQTIREHDDTPGRLKTPFIEDFVAVLSPGGEETQRISLVDALEASQWSPLLGKVPAGRHDPLGATSVQYVAGDAVKGMTAGPGERLLVSLGGLDTVAVIDLASRGIVWAAQGGLSGQHEARLLPDGEVLVAEAPGGKNARVRQVDLAAGTATWSYGGQEDQPIYGAERLSAQRLGNGNTLVSDTGGSRLFEVDKDGTVVWEFTNPSRGGEGDAYIPLIASGQRIEARGLDPEFRGFTRP